MVTKPHHSHIYYTLKELLKDVVPEGNESSKRYYTRVWKKWKEKHPGLPYRIQCRNCSGKEFKQDVKHGDWKVKTPIETIKDLLEGSD
jgi:hypothetical protein